MFKMNPPHLLLILFVFLSSPMHGQYEFLPGEKELIQLQEQRSTGNWRLSAYLKSEREWEIFRALLAVANIQNIDSILAGQVRTHLSHSSDSIRSAAAFALGMSGYQGYDEEYFALLRNESSSAVRKRLAEAIGRSGSSEALTVLINIAAETNDPQLRSETAIAIMRAGSRGLRPRESFEYCLALAVSGEERVQPPGLYTLWRLAPNPLLDSILTKNSTQLLALTHSKNDWTRLYLGALFGRVPPEIGLPGLTRLFETESKISHEQNLTQLALSIGSQLFRDPAFGKLGLQIAHMRNDNILSSFALALARIDTSSFPEIRLPLIDLLRDHVADTTALSPVTRGELLILLSRLNPAGIDIGLYANKERENELFRAKALEAAGVSGSMPGFELLIRYQVHPSLRLALSAWGFTPQAAAVILGSADSRVKKDSLFDTIVLNALTAVKRNSMPLTLVVSTALSDPSLLGRLRLHRMKDTLVAVHIEALKELSSPRDAEARVSLLRTITALDREKGIEYLRLGLDDPERSVVTSSLALLKGLGIDTSVTIARDYFLFRDREWEELDSIPDGQQVILHTSKGKIYIELNKRDAPVTVMHFLRLARSGFYEGTLFHRVVPNFVIQGGDPLGVGMGGPDYRLRTEVSLTEYAEGMVGMASSGKDTEGSQFFITSLPARHLDGRYTLFGKVQEGLDIVRRIQIGDTLERVEVTGQRR